MNCVSPGPTDTATFQEQLEEAKGMLANLHPMKRIGKPDEVATMLAFVARKGAHWVNGQILRVNGVSHFH